jgi:hypothetical protein
MNLVWAGGGTELASSNCMHFTRLWNVCFKTFEFYVQFELAIFNRNHE